MLDQGASASPPCGGPALCSEMGTRPVPRGFRVSEGDSDTLMLGAVLSQQGYLGDLGQPVKTQEF